MEATLDIMMKPGKYSGFILGKKIQVNWSSSKPCESESDYSSVSQ